LVRADVVVIAARGEERGLVAHALGETETEDTVVEGDGPLEVGDFEVDVADVGACRDWGHRDRSLLLQGRVPGPTPRGGRGARTVTSRRWSLAAN
jgi:hypothetical protein